MQADALFDAAFTAHQSGDLVQAQALYEQVLAEQPGHSAALHLSGLVAFQSGRLAPARHLILQAISAKPSADYFASLGLVLSAMEHRVEATEAFARAIAMRPEFSEAHNNLANLQRQLGQPEAAIQSYRRATAARPGFFEAHLNLGLALVDANDLAAAIVSLREAVALHPASADARNGLGIAHGRQGEWARAADCWREAIALRPRFPEALSNLGNALKELGRHDEATAALRAALAFQPEMAEAHNNLGAILFSQGRADEAIAAYAAALSHHPRCAEAHFNLAIALHAGGDVNNALAACEKALAIRSDWAAAWDTLGAWLAEAGHPQRALDSFANAIAFEPANASAIMHRGNVLRSLGRVAEAIASYEHSIRIAPRNVQTWNNLGVTLAQAGRLDDAVDAFDSALSLDPDLAEAHNNLANAYKDRGELHLALEAYARAMSLDADNPVAASNRLYTLQFHPTAPACEVEAEHRRWNEQFALPLQRSAVSHDNNPDAHRRLRIGYVAPDFRDHCQSLFTLPLLTHHDRRQVEIFCYSDVVAPDATTDRIRQLSDGWRDIAGQSDDRVAEMIRLDRIDILVDLSLHMSHNRLLVFAQKPAPVQATWLGYPGTTGMPAIDWRLSDPHLDPPGADERYAEKTIRLPDSFWCYDPMSASPAANEPPARRNGFITFGCLNNFCKVNDPTLLAWARVMRQTANSRLLLLAPQGTARRNVLATLAGAGIDASRVEFTARVSRRRYLELYNRIDIVLDTFPYCGHTTNLDAMWMGVPVVTRYGQSIVSRGGFSQLCNLGLTDLAAENSDDWAEIACVLAGDMSRLTMLRQTLRGRLEQSPLMDGRRFAANMEQAFGQMWRAWVEKMTAAGVGHGVTLHLSEAVRRRDARRAEEPRREASAA